MRTTDFTAAPAQANAECMFIGATRYRGPHAWLKLTPTWIRMVKLMKGLPGYRWHKVYWEFPFTLGTIAMFADQESMMRFARSKEHRKLMQWITKGNRNGNAGYIRIWHADPHGYTNGIWRAEENQQFMRHIERFTPVGAEQQGPYVDPALTRAEAKAEHEGQQQNDN